MITVRLVITPNPWGFTLSIAYDARYRNLYYGLAQLGYGPERVIVEGEEMIEFQKSQYRSNQ